MLVGVIALVLFKIEQNHFNQCLENERDNFKTYNCDKTLMVSKSTIDLFEAIIDKFNYLRNKENTSDHPNFMYKVPFG